MYYRLNGSSELYESPDFSTKLQYEYDPKRSCLSPIDEPSSDEIKNNFFNNECLTGCVQQIPKTINLTDFKIHPNCDDPLCPLVVYDTEIFQTTVMSEVC